jgi:spermidine synthase
VIHAQTAEKESAERSLLNSRSGFAVGLLILFAASGCAGLIYELVWFQMLQLVIGSTAVSLGALLAAFMGGMCLGSILLPRCVTSTYEPLRFWAVLEVGIAGLGVAVVFAVPWLAKVYAAVAPGGLVGVLVRGLLCALCLLPPTVLMGATLPAIARLAETTRSGVKWMGLLYAANTIGAVFGSLLAGFYLLRVYDVFTATYVAAGINGIVAIACLGLAGVRKAGRADSPSQPMEAGSAKAAGSETPPYQRSCHWPVYVTIGLSGLCALGAEVVWTRLLSLMLGGTTYTFSIILAVFLSGLGIGSAVGALVARRSTRPAVALCVCQWLLAVAIAWAAWALARSLPFWPINPSLAHNVWLVFQVDLVRCLWAVLPAASLWGATFPLALAAAAQPGGDPAELVGKLYAANTIGAILGALGTSVLLVPWLGTQQTQRALLALSAAGGMVVMVWELWPLFESRRVRATNGWLKLSSQQAVLTVAVCAITALLAWSVRPVPGLLVAHGRELPTKADAGIVLYVGEGMNASIAVTELDGGVRMFHVSGKVEASSDQQDMRLQRMLCHIPALLHADPRSVLVVGFGAGVTAGSFLVHPGVERISICEIEPLIPRAVAGYFSKENYDVVQNPRVRFIYDDARHFILTTREKFDVITSDPIHPWVKGAASLYTKEYFELCKQHLNPGGMVSQWVPLYETSLAAVKSEIATFFEVFPEGTVWANENAGAGYDLVLLGQAEPLEVDVETMQQRLRRPDHREAAQSLRDVGIRSAFGLVATYAGRSSELKPWLSSAQINRDRDLRLQYLAGLGLNLNESETIFVQLTSYRRFPEDIFIGSNIWNESLKRVFEQHKPGGEE